MNARGSRGLFSIRTLPTASFVKVRISLGDKLGKPAWGFSNQEKKSKLDVRNPMLRLCVTGSGGVGKSSLTIRYLRDEFTEYYDPTLEETYQKEIEYAGRLYDIEIVDTAGQEEFSSFRDSSLASGDAFLILFAINSQASWLEMKDLRSKIIEDKEQSSIPMIIVGNKRDLEHEREVEGREIEEYCTSFGIPYVETSAKTGLNVHEAFQLIYGQIHRLQAHMLERTLSKKPTRSRKDCNIV